MFFDHQLVISSFYVVHVWRIIKIDHLKSTQEVTVDQNNDETYHSYPFDVFLSVVASMAALLINSCNDREFPDASSRFSMDWLNFKIEGTEVRSSSMGSSKAPTHRIWISSTTFRDIDKKEQNIHK